MRIKALITLVVSAGKEIAPGKEYDLNEADAKSLIERGFAVAVKGGQKPATQQQPNKPEETGGKDDPSSQKGGGQPVQ
ncbi:MAG: hypothetical protein IJ099_00460 [Alphaproteobacteria bacterium]|nr:hypothetical protein [Alphaproteobacteria bacterium]